MKSSRLRSWPQVVPPVQMEPFWTGSVGVASTVTQERPPSKVVATYRGHTPVKPLLSGSLLAVSFYGEEVQ